MIIQFIGDAIVWIIMICAVLGCIAAIRDENSGMGLEFMTAFHNMGTIFIPMAGMMASIPFIAKFVQIIFGALYSAIGADIAMAPGMFIAIDLGGYQLVNAIAGSNEGWMMGMFVTYMFGPIVSFTIPVAFSLLDKRDHKFLALGIMAGLLSIPFGVCISSVLMKITNVKIRGEIATDGPSTTELNWTFSEIFLNLIPLIVFCILLALVLRFLTDPSVKVFLVFGDFLNAFVKIVLTLSIVEYFTGVFTKVFGSWGFDPIIADGVDNMRALENAGYICVMLAGAFPMVYLIQKYCEAPLKALGKKIGLSSLGSIATIGGMANLLAMFKLFPKMPPVDKVRVMAYCVCCAWILGDHIAFSANFQPTVLIPLLVGKFCGGIIAMTIAHFIAVPAARRYWKQDIENGIIGPDEYQAEDQLLPNEKNRVYEEKKAEKKAV